MRTADFDYPLPAELVAQHPLPRRDQSRLLVLHRENGQMEHRHFPDLLRYLNPGDVLVLNNSRVIPARLRGHKSSTGGQLEVLLVEENSVNDWWVMLRPGRRVRIGTMISISSTRGEGSAISAQVVEKNPEGHFRLQFSGTSDITASLAEFGEIPLPPYIRRAPGPSSAEDLSRYQTVYAQPPGSVAAPTAGLHCTPELLGAIRALGVHLCFVTLHVGLGTFAPVKVAETADHVMHEERFELSASTAHTINSARGEGRRIIAVGTTTVRVLESVAALAGGELRATAGRTRIFIHPPFRFRVADALVTNFHLPQSTLLMLVSAFAAPEATRGRELMLHAYAEAVRERYRFFSYGDAMFIR